MTIIRAILATAGTPSKNVTTAGTPSKNVNKILGVIFLVVLAEFISMQSLLFTIPERTETGYDASGMRKSDPFDLSQSTWNWTSVEEFERKSIRLQPTTWNPPYSPRRPPAEDFQRHAELENEHEIVRYIANVAGIKEKASRYLLHVHVIVTGTQQGADANNATIPTMEGVEARWKAILASFKLPDFVNVKVTYADSDSIQPLNTKSMADWILFVDGSTYVNLDRLVHRLIAEIDPTMPGFHGDLSDIIVRGQNRRLPLLRAGIVVTGAGMKDTLISNSTRRCWQEQGAHLIDWCNCIAAKNASDAWNPMPGMNLHDPLTLATSSLDGSLYGSSYMEEYQSVGGSEFATARLPITYANLDDDQDFQLQLAVDSRKAQIPKIFHQMWIGDKSRLRKEDAAEAERCRQMHESRGWKYILWDEDKISKLKGIPDLTSMVKEGNMHLYVDSIRYHILYQFGGVYSDIDAQCIRPFDGIIDHANEKGVDFVIGRESDWHREDLIANGVFGATTRSPVLMAMLLHLGRQLVQYRPKWRVAAWTISGPMCPTEVAARWRSWLRGEKMLVLPSTAFIPTHFAERPIAKNKSEVEELAKKQGSYTLQFFKGS